MPNPRKPTAGFWIVVGVTALVLYVLSSGPALRLTQDDLLPEIAADFVYAPLGAAMSICPSWAVMALLHYWEFCGVRLEI